MLLILPSSARAMVAWPPLNNKLFQVWAVVGITVQAVIKDLEDSK